LVHIGLKYIRSYKKNEKYKFKKNSLLLSGKKDMTPKIVQKFKLYAPAATALLLVLIAFIIEILVFLNHKTVQKQEGQDQTYVQSFASTNGFQGAVVRHEAKLSTSLSGLVKGSNGQLVNASPNDVILAKLVNFVPITNSPIVAPDTILQAMGKLVVLRQTILDGYIEQTPNHTPMSGNLTIMEGFESIQSQLSASPFLFSVGPMIANSNTVTPIWGPLLSGSTTIPQNTLFAGSVIQMITSGTISITITTTVNISLTVGATSISLSFAGVLSGNYFFSFETILGLLTDGITFSAICTFNITSTSSQVSTKDIFTSFVIDPTQDILLNLSGNFTSVQAGTQISTTSGNGYFLYKSTS
jgi:hypothetical protein